MNLSLARHTHECLTPLVETYGLKLKTEVNVGQTYEVEYCANDFVINIEKNFRELYPTVYSVRFPDRKIAVFNLLGYLKRGSENIPEGAFFRKESNLEECYRKQLQHLSRVLYENFELIADFFGEAVVELNLSEFESFWRLQHPEMY